MSLDVLRVNNDSNEDKSYYKHPEKSQLPLKYTPQTLGLYF